MVRCACYYLRVLCAVSLVLCVSLFLSLSLWIVRPILLFLVCFAALAPFVVLDAVSLTLSLSHFKALSGARVARAKKIESPALGAHALFLAVLAALAAMASLAVLDAPFTYALPVPWLPGFDHSYMGFKGF